MERGGRAGGAGPCSYLCHPSSPLHLLWQRQRACLWDGCSHWCFLLAHACLMCSTATAPLYLLTPPFPPLLLLLIIIVIVFSSSSSAAAAFAPSRGSGEDGAHLKSFAAWDDDGDDDKEEEEGGGEEGGEEEDQGEDGLGSDLAYIPPPQTSRPSYTLPEFSAALPWHQPSVVTRARSHPLWDELSRGRELVLDCGAEASASASCTAGGGSKGRRCRGRERSAAWQHPPRGACELASVKRVKHGYFGSHFLSAFSPRCLALQAQRWQLTARFQAVAAGLCRLGALCMVINEVHHVVCVVFHAKEGTAARALFQQAIAIAAADAARGLVRDAAIAVAGATAVAPGATGDTAGAAISTARVPVAPEWDGKRSQNTAQGPHTKRRA
jgi:hypothetical protein